MSELSSSLYVGRLKHSRLRPMGHTFEYRVFHGLFDVDELASLDTDLKLFSLGRRNLFGLDLKDHGPGDGSAWRPWVESTLEKAGVTLDGGPIKLLCFPRIVGYAFNPISVWYGYGPGGELRGVIHEVRNTFGDVHFYVAPVEADNTGHRVSKQMHVSPFNDLDQEYVFTINDPGKRLLLAIDQVDNQGVMFRAGLRLTRHPLTDGALARVFVTHPLLTLKVIGGIHWQALRLWLKGAKYHSRPAPPINSITQVERSLA